MKKHKQGYFLIEALLSIVIFSVLVLSIFSMIGFLQRRVTRSDFESEAGKVLQDGMEIAHSAVLADWSAYADGDYYPVFDADDKTWILLSGEEEGIETRFGRKISLSRVCRDKSSGERLETAVCGGDIDPRSREIMVSVWWAEESKDKLVEAKLLVLNTNE